MDVAKSMPSGVVVSYIDGRDSVTTKMTPRGQVAAERQFGCPIAALDRAEQMYYLVWASLHYSGKESNDFESFLDIVEDIRPNAAPTSGEDPTQPAQPPDSSLS